MTGIHNCSSGEVSHRQKRSARRPMDALSVVKWMDNVSKRLDRNELQVILDRLEGAVLEDVANEDPSGVVDGDFVLVPCDHTSTDGIVQQDLNDGVLITRKRCYALKA